MIAHDDHERIGPMLQARFDAAGTTVSHRVVDRLLRHAIQRRAHILVKTVRDPLRVIGERCCDRWRAAPLEVGLDGGRQAKQA